MTEGLSWEAIGVISGVVLFVGAGLFGMLLRHGGMLSRIMQQLLDMATRHEENREDHGRLWVKVDDHEHRLTRLEASRRDE